MRVHLLRRPHADVALTSQSSGEDDDEVTGPVNKQLSIRQACNDYYYYCSARHHPNGAATHKAQLANLANTDPDFYQFLQEQDEELLQFSEEDVSDQSDDIENLTQSDQATVPVIDLLYYDMIWIAVTQVTKKRVVTYQVALKWKESIIKVTMVTL